MGKKRIKTIWDPAGTPKIVTGHGAFYTMTAAKLKKYLKSLKKGPLLGQCKLISTKWHPVDIWDYKRFAISASIQILPGDLFTCPRFLSIDPFHGPVFG